MRVKYCGGSARVKMMCPLSSPFYCFFLSPVRHERGTGGEVAEARASVLRALFLRCSAWLMINFFYHLLVTADDAMFFLGGASKAFALEGILRFSVIAWPLAKCVGSCQ